VVFESPEKYDPNATSCMIRVPQQMIATLRRHLETHPEIGPRAQYFQWYTSNFDTIAREAYHGIGSPEIQLDNAWDIFRSMSEPIKALLM
jgi:hypothetical protein